jgi:hypothetical protein
MVILCGPLVSWGLAVKLAVKVWNWSLRRPLRTQYADDWARPACGDKARKAVLLVLI